MNISRILVLISILIFSCTSKQKTKINSVDFGEQLVAGQNLRYYFNNDVIDTSETGIWKKNDGLFLIEPNVEGEYNWISRSSLIFKPTTSYEPSQEYTILLNEVILSEKGIGILNQGAISTRGPDPFISNLTAFWRNRSINGSVSSIALDITFNYDVIPNQLKDKFEFTLDSIPLEIYVQSQSVSKVLSLGVPLNTKKGPITIKMALLPGATDASGSIVYDQRLKLGEMSFKNMQASQSVRSYPEKVKTSNIKSEKEDQISKVITKEATEEEIQNLESLDEIIEGADEMQKQQALFYKANTFQKMGKIREAIKVWNQLIDLDESSYDYYNNRGVCYNATGEYGLAIKDLTKAIELDVQNVGAYVNRGFANSEKGDYAEAINDFNVALTFDASHPFAHNNLAYVMIKENRLYEAKQHLDASLNTDPYNSWLFRNYAFYYATEQNKSLCIDNIKKSINLGYTDKNWFKKESAFNFIKNDKEFINAIK